MMVEARLEIPDNRTPSQPSGEKTVAAVVRTRFTYLLASAASILCCGETPGHVSPTF